MKLPNFVYQYIEKLKANKKIKPRKIDELHEPELFLRSIGRSMITLVMSAFLMVAAGGLLSYPGGVPVLLAQVLVWANHTAGGNVPFEQLMGALGAALIFMCNFTLLMFFVMNEPVLPSDLRDMFLDYDEIMAERTGGIQYTLDEEIIPRFNPADDDLVTEKLNKILTILESLQKKK